MNVNFFLCCWLLLLCEWCVSRKYYPWLLRKQFFLDFFPDRNIHFQMVWRCACAHIFFACVWYNTSYSCACFNGWRFWSAVFLKPKHSWTIDFRLFYKWMRVVMKTRAVICVANIERKTNALEVDGSNHRTGKRKSSLATLSLIQNAAF